VSLSPLKQLAKGYVLQGQGHIELPDHERIIGHPGSIWFKFWRTESGVLPEKIEKSLPPEALCYSLYILEWESQINIAAGDMSFTWLDSNDTPATA
jgi:hypothetical protein